MGLATHLPKEVQDIAADQGWDDFSLGLILLGALERLPGSREAIIARARDVAEEENDAAKDLDI
jgi:hypothetical protein